MLYRGDGVHIDYGVGNRHIRHTIVASEAYVTIGNLARNPFYLIFGKKYLPFGEYKNPYTPYGVMSPTQMLSQFNAVTAIAGVSTDFGFYANVFGFRGDTIPVGSTAGNIRNFGAKSSIFPIPACMYLSGIFATSGIVKCSHQT